MTIEETLNEEIKEEIGVDNFENHGLFYAVISNIEIKEKKLWLTTIHRVWLV